MSRPRRWIVFTLVALAALLGAGYWWMVACEGRYAGEPLEAAWLADGRLAALADSLRASAAHLAVTIGPRNPPRYAALCAARDWVRARWRAQGYEVREQSFSLGGLEFTNLEVEVPGRLPEAGLVLVTAQYDTWPDSPGANNNASGMAVLLEVSRLARDLRPERPLRLVAFSVQEPPWHELGSRRYAQRSRERGERIHVMMSMDAIGIYRHERHTQKLPWPVSLLYPDRGDFLAFITDLGSRPRVVEATRGFRRGSAFRLEAGAFPRAVKGVTWSDHHSFWDQGYRAIQITDTGAFRAASHTNAADTLGNLDFTALARITLGMYGSVLELTGAGEGR